MAPTPSATDDSHQQLLDRLDIATVPKPFRNPQWKPPQRRNKNVKAVLTEASRKEASLMATQNNSGTSTPLPHGSSAASNGIATPSSVTNGNTSQSNIAQAAQSLSTLVLEKNFRQS